MKISNLYLFIWVFFLLSACNFSFEIQNFDTFKKNKTDIDTMLDKWHRAAATADFNTYFALLDNDAVFVGTDSSEVWSKNEFMNFAKPYFERGKVWNFHPLNRHIYQEKNLLNQAWFDETLDTWMGVCRGSGVVIKKDGQWLIKHYVLSMTIPNEKVKTVLEVLK